MALGLTAFAAARKADAHRMRAVSLGAVATAGGKPPTWSPNTREQEAPSTDLAALAGRPTATKWSRSFSCSGVGPKGLPFSHSLLEQIET